MAISLIKQYGRTLSQKREFICDTVEDLNTIPYPQLGMSAYVVNEAASYIYSNGWMVKQGANSDDGSGGSDGAIYDSDALEMLVEADMLPAVHDASGAILTDENGNVVLRY